MRKIFFCVLAFLVFTSHGYCQVLKIAPHGMKTVKKLVVYGDENEIFIPSGWMGDTDAITVTAQCPIIPHGGKYCQKWTYTLKAGQKQGWAGVYWQYPANNWGSKKGYDLTGYKKLSFWIRGDKGGEVVNIKIGGIKGGFPDTFSKELGAIKLSTAWKQYVIDLSGRDLSNIAGGFCWTADSGSDPKGCAFYLDDITYE